MNDQLCRVCGGNGVVKIPGGVSICDHCDGKYWEPAVPGEPKRDAPDFWRCRTCGCLWRDNHDGTVSLGGAKETSCAECEPKPTAEACEPLYRSAHPTATVLRELRLLVGVCDDRERAIDGTLLARMQDVEAAKRTVALKAAVQELAAGFARLARTEGNKS